MFLCLWVYFFNVNFWNLMFETPYTYTNYICNRLVFVYRTLFLSKVHLARTYEVQFLTAVVLAEPQQFCLCLPLEGSLPLWETCNCKISWTPAHRDVNRPFLFYWRSERNIDAVIETRKLRLCLEPLAPSKTRIFVCLRETGNQQCRLIAHIWHLTSYSLQIYF